jgi:hypothetical protein
LLDRRLRGIGRRARRLQFRLLNAGGVPAAVRARVGDGLIERSLRGADRRRIRGDRGALLIDGLGRHIALIFQRLVALEIGRGAGEAHPGLAQRILRGANRRRILRVGGVGLVCRLRVARDIFRRRALRGGELRLEIVRDQVRERLTHAHVIALLHVDVADGLGEIGRNTDLPERREYARDLQRRPDRTLLRDDRVDVRTRAWRSLRCCAGAGRASGTQQD